MTVGKVGYSLFENLEHFENRNSVEVATKSDVAHTDPVMVV